MSGGAVVALFENADSIKSSYAVKVGLAQMLRGGVVMDVCSPYQARIAEEAGAVAVMVVDDAVREVARMIDPDLIKEIKKAVTVPVIAQARIGHFVEAQVLEAVGVDFIDESELLTPADDMHHINKHNFRIPFVCGCRNLGDALCRIAEGAAMIRTEGDAVTGNIMEAAGQVRSILGDVRSLQGLGKDELHSFAKRIRAPYEFLKLTKPLGRLPVVGFAAGGVSTPADAAMMMQLGCDGVFVSSEIFKNANPARRARAFVQAVASYNDSQLLAEVSTEYGEDMEEVVVLDKNEEEQQKPE